MYFGEGMMPKYWEWVPSLWQKSNIRFVTRTVYSEDRFSMNNLDMVIQHSGTDHVQIELPGRYAD